MSKATASKPEKRGNGSLVEHFDGKKAKWLPLFHRLVARLSAMPGVEFCSSRGGISIEQTREGKPNMGVVRITLRGLEIGLGLEKAPRSERLRPSQRSPKWVTHRVVIAKASDIDEEFISWVNAARIKARTAKVRST